MKSLRQRAADALMSYESDGTYINLVIDKYADGLCAADRASFTAMLYGTVERRITLDYYIASLAARSTSSLEAHTRALLRLGIYQLAFMDKTAAYAAVNETVACAKGRGEASLVNAVLREYIRRGGVPLPPREKNPVRYLSIKYSFPTDIVRAFMAKYGEERCERILDSFNAVSPLTIRVNTLKTTRFDYAQKLAEGGFTCTPTEYSPNGLVLPSVSPTKLPDFDLGAFFVQNESSQLATMALGARSGEVVVDVCACPGGKSFGAAMDMEGEGEIHSFDVRESKLSLIESGARRLDIDIIRCEALDGRAGKTELLGRTDKVICDVPCSGLGVLGEKPDLRYKSAEDIASLPALQYEILTSASRYLREGGELVYSTCTVLDCENRDVFTQFLAEHEDFEYCDFDIHGLCSTCGMLEITPDGVRDGFFISKLKRKKK